MLTEHLNEETLDKNLPCKDRKHNYTNKDAEYEHLKHERFLELFIFEGMFLNSNSWGLFVKLKIKNI